MATAYHIPALLHPTIDGLNIRKDGVYVDCTFGGGGHSKEIISHLSPAGRLYGFDQDIDALSNRLPQTNFIFVNSNFRYIKNFMRYYHEEHIDGIIADLGVSFHHFDDASRGFSFRFDGPLDMRMNRNSALTAEYIINNYSESDLANLFFIYGEMPNSRQVAKLIVKKRNSPIKTTAELVDILTPIVGKDKEKKDLARLFQALRIEVNDEMGALREMLQSAQQLLTVGGRIAILTYHSLEDRLVKNFFRSGNLEGKIEKDFYGNIISPFKLVNNKVITASDEEVASNPRSRSAKLRIAEKI